MPVKSPVKSPVESAQQGAQQAGSSQLFDSDEMTRTLRRLAHEIIEQHALDNEVLENNGADPVEVVLLGIPTRGVPIAKRIAAAIEDFAGIRIPVGSVDVGLYRDDLDHRPTTRLGPTDIPVNLDGRTVILVDDVLYTGRTIRAALDAIADLGRPAAIQLAALIDRGHRQLPIRADYVGKNLPTAAAERITVLLDEVDGSEGVWLERSR